MLPGPGSPGSSGFLSSLLSSNFTLPLYSVTASALDIHTIRKMNRLWMQLGGLLGWCVGGWVEFGVRFGGSKSVMVGLC